MLHGRITLWVLALALGIGLLAAAPAGAVTYTVTTTADTPVSTPCLQNDCSLRAAVEAASSPLPAAQPDLVVVPPGTYTLTVAPLTIPSGQTQITIAGAGAGKTVISGAQARRVLVVQSSAQIAVNGVTLRDGFASDGGQGGNAFVQSGASLALDHVRVTGGFGGRGAGVASLGAQRVEIANSLIDQNFALIFPHTDGGGGMLIDGATGGNTALQIRNTTIALNQAQFEGGGIAVRNNANGTMALQGVTIAGNQTAAVAGGGVFAAAGQLRFAGSILARNTGANSLASNCAGTIPADNEGNVESGADCGLKSPASRQTTDPQLSAALVDAGGQTPLFSLAPTSPAIDLATCTTTTDQRDLARPQGARCDAGAYELAQAADPPPQDPAPLVLPPVRQLVPVARQHVIGVTASGKVLVRLPGTKRFVPLSQVTELPLGTVVNATGGKIRITSAADANGRTQTAVFYDGIFKIGETGPAKRLITVLALFGNEPVCPKAKAKSKRSHASRKSKSRRLWGDGKGRFQTKGQYSSATVRGTKWLVQDSCKGTLSKVARGSVTVRDFVKRKNVIVKAGRSYLAKPRR